MKFFAYFSEIEDLFNTRRGKHVFFRPIELALIETWSEREVPLEVVKAGINKALNRVEDPKRIKSLMYCRGAVEEEHERYLKSKEK